MNSRNVAARGIAGLLPGFAIVTALVMGLCFNVGTQAAGGAVSGTARIETEQRVSAPLKPDWVEAMLDCRATARRSLLEARDLLAAPPRSQPQQAPGAAPLQPDWVEALLNSRATALRAMLEASDLLAAHAEEY